MYQVYYDINYGKYCGEIYNQVKNMEFRYAKMQENLIITYDDKFNEISSISHKNYNPKYEIVYIDNEEDRMIFWESASLDDGSGYIFIKDDEVNNKLKSVFSGVYRIERGDLNSYWFSTY